MIFCCVKNVALPGVKAVWCRLLQCGRQRCWSVLQPLLLHPVWSLSWQGTPQHPWFIMPAKSRKQEASSWATSECLQASHAAKITSPLLVSARCGPHAICLTPAVASPSLCCVNQAMCTADCQRRASRTCGWYAAICIYSLHRPEPYAAQKDTTPYSPNPGRDMLSSFTSLAASAG